MTRKFIVSGDYDKDTNMYIAKYVYGEQESVVKGRSRSTKFLKEHMGVIRAIEHVVSYCEFLGIRDFTIYHTSQMVENMFTHPKPSYPELNSAYKILLPYKSKLIYKEVNTDEL